MRAAVTWLCAAALAAGLGAAVAEAQRGSTTSVTVRQLRIRQTAVRVPIRPAPIRLAAPIAWKERRGPKCLPSGGLAGAQLSRPGSIDLFLRDGRAMRAELAKRCPGLDLHRGFYMRATADGRMCAGRDSVYARSGGQCEIKRFRRLTRVGVR